MGGRRAGLLQGRGERGESERVMAGGSESSLSNCNESGRHCHLFLFMLCLLLTCVFCVGGYADERLAGRVRGMKMPCVGRGNLPPQSAFTTVCWPKFSVDLHRCNRHNSSSAPTTIRNETCFVDCRSQIAVSESRWIIHKRRVTVLCSAVITRASGRCHERASSRAGREIQNCRRYSIPRLHHFCCSQGHAVALESAAGCAEPDKRGYLEM